MTGWSALGKTKPTQYYASPTHRTDSIAHGQSKNPMAQTADSQPSQTAPAQLRKLPTQLNTPSIFVPDLVLVSPNASDVQRFGRCVPVLRLSKHSRENCELVWDFSGGQYYKIRMTNNLIRGLTHFTLTFLSKVQCKYHKNPCRLCYLTANLSEGVQETLEYVLEYFLCFFQSFRNVW